MIEILSTERKKSFVVTSRDLEVLKNLSRYRFLTVQEVKRLCFSQNINSLRTQQRLKLLYDIQLISRLMAFRDNGSRQGYIYTLSPEGRNYLAANNEDVPVSSFNNPVKYLYLQHCVDVSKFWVDLTLAVQKVEGLTLSLFAPDWQIRAQSQETNSLKNRELYQEISVSNSKEKFVVFPDGLFILSAKDEEGKTHNKLFALEIDRGTESLQVIQRKIISYVFARQQNKFGKYPGHDDLTILIQCSSEKRASNIRNCLVGIQGNDLAWVTNVQSVSDDTLLLKPIWIDSRGKRRAILA